MAKKATAWIPVPGRYGSVWLPGKMWDGGQPAPEPMGTITFNWTLVEVSGGGYTYIDDAPIIEGIDNPPTLIVGALEINSPSNLQGDFIRNRFRIQFIREEGDTEFSLGNPLNTQEQLNPQVADYGGGLSVGEISIWEAGTGNRLGIDPETTLVLPLYPALEPEFFPEDYWEIYTYKYLTIWPETSGFSFYNAASGAFDQVALDQDGNRLPPSIPRPNNLQGRFISYSTYNTIIENDTSWAYVRVSTIAELNQEVEEQGYIVIVTDFNEGKERFPTGRVLVSGGYSEVNDAYNVQIEEDPWEVETGASTRISLEVVDSGSLGLGHPINFQRIGTPSRIDNYLTATYRVDNLLSGVYSGELKLFQYYDASDAIISVVFELTLESPYPFRFPWDIVLGRSNIAYKIYPVRSPSGTGHKLVSSCYESDTTLLPFLDPELETIIFNLSSRHASNTGLKNEDYCRSPSTPTYFNGLNRDPDIEYLLPRIGVRSEWFGLPHDSVKALPLAETTYAYSFLEFLIIYSGVLTRTSVGYCYEIGFRPRQLDRLSLASGEWKVIVDVRNVAIIEFIVDLGSAIEDKLYEYTFPLTEQQREDMLHPFSTTYVSIERP